MLLIYDGNISLHIFCIEFFFWVKHEMGNSCKWCVDFQKFASLLNYIKDSGWTVNLKSVLFTIVRFWLNEDSHDKWCLIEEEFNPYTQSRLLSSCNSLFLVVSYHDFSLLLTICKIWSSVKFCRRTIVIWNTDFLTQNLAI